MGVLPGLRVLKMKNPVYRLFSTCYEPDTCLQNIFLLFVNFNKPNNFKIFKVLRLERAACTLKKSSIKKLRCTCESAHALLNKFSKIIIARYISIEKKIMFMNEMNQNRAKGRGLVNIKILDLFIFLIALLIFSL